MAYQRRDDPRFSFRGFGPPPGREGWFPRSGYRGGVRGGRFGRKDGLVCANPTFEQMARHWFYSFGTNPSAESFVCSHVHFEFQVGDLKNIWLIDSGCSKHMTGDNGWFSSLVPVLTKRYITFGDNGRGRVLSEGEVKVSDKITLRRVARVQWLGYNLLSVSQLLDEGFEVLFRPGGSRILDSRGDLVCIVVPKGQVFRADFCQSSSVERCFLAGSSSELWKWHRKLGHLSFDLLSRLSKLSLVRGFPRLRLEKELVCAPCRHAKMVASSHPPLTDVMTERPCEPLHMDLVGPARVRSAGGKWYILVVVDDYCR
jgi:hypothetical protein